MKKMLAMGLVCAMVLAPAVLVNAAEVPETCHVSGCSLGDCFKDIDCDGICGDHFFVDEDYDGVCDYHCYLDEDADGICDHFVDADEDGICDHCHDHGKPVQTDSNAGSTQKSSTYNYSSGYHGSSHHSSRRGCHRGGCC